MFYSKLPYIIFGASLSLFVQSVSGYSKFDEDSEQIRQTNPKRHAMVKSNNQPRFLKPHARKINPIPTYSNSRPEQKPRKPYMMTR